MKKNILYTLILLTLSSFTFFSCSLELKDKEADWLGYIDVEGKFSKYDGVFMFSGNYPIAYAAKDKDTGLLFYSERLITKGYRSDLTEAGIIYGILGKAQDQLNETTEYVSKSLLADPSIFQILSGSDPSGAEKPEAMEFLGKFNTTAADLKKMIGGLGGFLGVNPYNLRDIQKGLNSQYGIDVKLEEAFVNAPEASVKPSGEAITNGVIDFTAFIGEAAAYVVVDTKKVYPKISIDGIDKYIKFAKDNQITTDFGIGKDGIIKDDKATLRVVARPGTEYTDLKVVLTKKNEKGMLSMYTGKGASQFAQQTGGVVYNIKDKKSTLKVRFFGKKESDASYSRITLR